MSRLHGKGVSWLVSLTVDTNNNLWISDDGSLLYYNGYNFFWINNPEESYNFFRNIYMDSNDILWGFSRQGLVRYDGNEYVFFNIENSDISSNYVFSFTEDQNNVKWIGTDAGVCRFDGATWTTFNTTNSGLCNNNVNAIAVEKNNTIWFGTDNGVSRYTGEIIPAAVDDAPPQPLPLIRAFPNPFNPSTAIEYTLAEPGTARISIYSIAGQKVRELVTEDMSNGTHRTVWDGRDSRGKEVSAGVYIMRLKAGEAVATGKMTIIR
jgi:hypothetical protein